MMTHPDSLGFSTEVEEFKETQKISESLIGYLRGIEVSHSDVGFSLNQLGMANEIYDIADQIPPKTIIFVLEYFNNSVKLRVLKI
jgi:hypothetical protein